MKKIMLISGIAAVFLLAIILAGADKDDGAKKALRQGNSEYAVSLYKYALAAYETGLASNPENKALNFNAAQAAYSLGEYEKAAGYYEKAEDCVEKYLNTGNIYFKAGDAAGDEDQKMQYYSKALQIYYEGIIKFPRDVPLKYNYETLKEKIKTIPENTEEQENQGQDSEEQENQGQDSGESREEEPELDEEAIERILQMLENQEEESLKNNREILAGGDNKNDW